MLVQHSDVPDINGRLLIVCRRHTISSLRDNRIAYFIFEEAVMGQRPFKKPVFLRLNSTGNYQARSAWEALEYLDLHWPEEHSAHSRRAQQFCRDAVDGALDAEPARLALIDAAQRAGLIEEGWQTQANGARTVFRSVRQVEPQLAAEDCLR